MFRTTFYGKEISDYGRKYGRVDYRTLASTFDAVLCNSILGYRDGFDEWEQIHGFVDNSEQIAEKEAEVEELTERLEEAKEEKKEAERAHSDLAEICENLDELMERFESFEYEAGELLELMRWRNFETPTGEDFDTDAIEREIEGLDFWGMREAIESYQSEVEDGRDSEEEAFNEAEEEEKELSKQIEALTAEIEELEEEDTTEAEVFQWYIISDSGYQILSENTNEIIYYNEELDIYLWGVTHWGTAWDYVLTSIPCETYEQTKAREQAEAEEEAETAELEAVEFFDIMDELDSLEEVEEVAELEESGELEMHEIEWRVAMKGDIVKANEFASCYGCTKGDWVGEIIRLDEYDGDEPTKFTAKTVSGGVNTFCGEEFSYLNPMAFDVFARDAEGVDE